VWPLVPQPELPGSDNEKTPAGRDALQALRRLRNSKLQRGQPSTEITKRGARQPTGRQARPRSPTGWHVAGWCRPRRPRPGAVVGGVRRPAIAEAHAVGRVEGAARRGAGSRSRRGSLVPWGGSCVSARRGAARCGVAEQARLARAVGWVARRGAARRGAGRGAGPARACRGVGWGGVGRACRRGAARRGAGSRSRRGSRVLSGGSSVSARRWVAEQAHLAHALRPPRMS
jgi:hypothetical protein